MHEWAGRYPGVIVTGDDSLDAEFEMRVREASTLAFRVAYGVLRHQQDAEDTAQEAFVRAHAHFASLRDGDRFRAWLVRTTWRLAIDRWRSQRRRAARELTAGTGAIVSTEEIASEQQRATLLWKAIDTLPPKLRFVLVLSAIEGHDVKDVARLATLPEGTVKSRLFLARKHLAQRLRCLARDTTRR
jgi:RNA polymerase sigma-70 factor (ECF subfamily)